MNLRLSRQIAGKGKLLAAIRHVYLEHDVVFACRQILLPIFDERLSQRTGSTDQKRLRRHIRNDHIILAPHQIETKLLIYSASCLRRAGIHIFFSPLAILAARKRLGLLDIHSSLCLRLNRLRFFFRDQHAGEHVSRKAPRILIFIRINKYQHNQRHPQRRYTQHLFHHIPKPPHFAMGIHIHDSLIIA